MGQLRYLRGSIITERRRSGRRLNTKSTQSDRCNLWIFPVTSVHLRGVMAGLVPPSTSFFLKTREKDVDSRDKRGHDVERSFDLIGTRFRARSRRPPPPH